MSPRLRPFFRSFPLLFLLSARAFGAPDEVPGECQTKLGDISLWAAIKTADRCAAVPGLSASQRTEALVEAADIRSRVGDQAGAERSLREALKLKPEDPDASFLLAQITRDRPEQALPRAERAARFAISYRRKAAAHRLAAEIALDLEDKPGARSHLARALELGGEDLDTLGVMVLAERDRPGRAAAYAQRACATAEAAPQWKRAAALRRCAHILLDVKDYTGAAERLESALAISPDDLAALWALVLVKHRRAQESAPSAARPAGQAEGAIPARIKEDPIRTLAADPENLEALALLVASKRAENRIAEAIALAERFTDAARRAPAWFRNDAYSLSAQMWFDFGDIQRTYRSYLLADDADYEALSSFPHMPGVFELLPEAAVVRPLQDVAFARIELGDRAGAQATLERTLARFPDNAHILRDLVVFKLAQSKPDEALAYAKRLVKAAEKSSLKDVLRRQPPRDFLVKGFTLSGVSQMEAIALYLKIPEGIKNAETARRQERCMAFQTMARVQLARGRLPQARTWLERALKMVPDDASALQMQSSLRKN